MPISPLYDCTQCGACCQCFPIFASQSDSDREPAIKSDAQLLAPHMRRADRVYRLHPLPFLETCAFLKPDLLCRIYETRPDVCRRFEAGSPQCQEARQHLGMTNPPNPKIPTSPPATYYPTPTKSPLPA